MAAEESLATKAAEEELQRRIEGLKAELQRATEALKSLQSGDLKSERKSDSGSNAPGAVNLSSCDSQLSRSSVIVRPSPKRGYLFKWNDRSIGWGGTKWALRFVVLEGGRVSYFLSHTDKSPRYVLSLRGCAVRDDGWKRNRRHSTKKGQDPPLQEPGAYFFVFSIYQRPDSIEFMSPKKSAESDDSEMSESDIVPLLRFSTPSLAEKTQWIQLLSEACAYCETDAFLDDEEARLAEETLQQQQKASMAIAMPEAKEGTLPPLLFAPVQMAHPARRPSFSKLPRAESYRTLSKNPDTEKTEGKTRKGYPPSKPMHRSAAPSLLSAEAPAQNYRGFFNLGFVILVLR